MPTKIAVNIFNPIWKLNVAPTIFITYIRKPPNIELSTNFIIALIGIIKTLPIKNIKIIQAKYTIKLELSKFITSLIQFYE